jgi:hypothetical protein
VIQDPDNSIRNLRRDLSAVTCMFCGFDGRIMVAGNKRMLRDDTPIDEERMQQLPASLIGFPDDYSPLQKVLFTAYRKRRVQRARS